MTNSPKKDLVVDLDSITLRLSSSEVATQEVDPIKLVADEIYESDNLTTASELDGFFPHVREINGLRVFNKISRANFRNVLINFLDTVYQAILVTGTNIKSVNGESLLGSGNLEIESGGVQWITKTSSYTAAPNEYILFDISSNATLTLPSSPSSNTAVNFALNISNNAILTINGNGKNINGNSSITTTKEGEALLIYNGTEWLFFYQKDNEYDSFKLVTSGMGILAFPSLSFSDISVYKMIDSKGEIL